MYTTIASNQLDITIKVTIDKVNRFVSIYSETGAFIKVEASTTYSVMKNNATGAVYFDYPDTLSSLLFKVSLLNTDNGTIWFSYIDFNDATISVVEVDNQYQVN